MRFVLMKAGGPFMGPRGGKWADAAHTIPWDDEQPRALFHSAPIDSMESIKEHGLRPRSGAGLFNHGSYGEHSQGKVFLSAHPTAARAWHEKVGNMLSHHHDDAEKHHAVLLRISARPTKRDEVGDRDVAGSRYTTGTVKPDHIEFFDKDKGWRPIAHWEAGQDAVPSEAQAKHPGREAHRILAERAEHARAQQAAAQREHVAAAAHAAERASMHAAWRGKSVSEREGKAAELLAQRQIIRGVSSLTDDWRAVLGVDAKGKVIAEGSPKAGYAATVMPHPKLKMWSELPLEVHSVIDGKAHISLNSNRGTIPEGAAAQLVTDLEGRVSASPVKDPAVNAVVGGSAEFLGKGDDGLAFKVGKQVVKVSTTTPYQPMNLGNYRTPERALSTAREQHATSEKLRALGIPVLPERFVEHDGRGYTIKPYVEIPDKLTAAQTEEAHSAVLKMHAAGYVLGDEVQVGVHEGKIVLFDIGKARESKSADAVRDDLASVETLHSMHGHTYEPRGGQLTDRWHALTNQARNKLLMGSATNRAKLRAKLQATHALVHAAATDDLDREFAANDLEDALAQLDKEDKRMGKSLLSLGEAASLLKARRLHGRMRFQGMDISIENAAGTFRYWTDNDGSQGSTLIKFPYGYIRGTLGIDGDHVDVYVGPHENASQVFIVTQMNKRTGFRTVDEQKAMIGFESAADAKAAYHAQYDDPRFFGSMRSMPLAVFRHKVLDKRNHGELIRSQPALRFTFDALTKASQLTPPSGFFPAPGTHNGGYRKMVGGKWVYWYPDYGGTNARPRWTEDHFAQGKFDKTAHHWEHKQTNKKLIAWVPGGVDPSSKHPVKEAGRPHLLWQIEQAEVEPGWARLRNVASGETKLTRHERILPIVWEGKKAAVSPAEAPSTPAWDPESETGAAGATGQAGAKLAPWAHSTALPGSALHALEHGVFKTKASERFEEDADGKPRKVKRVEPEIPDSTKVALMAEFEPLLASAAGAAVKRFGLDMRWTYEGKKRTSETLADLHASAMEGMLRALQTYPGGTSFGGWAKQWVHDYARLEGAKQLAGGMALPRRHARLLASYIAARAQASRAFDTGEPSPEQVASLWRVKKRDVHDGLGAAGAEDMPLGNYKLRTNDKTVRGDKQHAGKREWAENFHAFLAGVKSPGVIGSDDDEGPAFPAVGTGHGMSVDERLHLRAAAKRALASLTDHEIRAGARGTAYRADTSQLLVRTLGLDGTDGVALPDAVSEVPIKRLIDGKWTPVGRTMALELAPQFIAAGMAALKRDLGEERAGLLDQASARIAPAVIAKPGPTFKQLLLARARTVPVEAVQAFRASERVRIKTLRQRVQLEASRMEAGPARVYAESTVLGLEAALGRVDKLSNQECAIEIVKRASSESEAMRRLQTQHVELDAHGADTEYGHATVSLTDLGTGAQRFVRMRSFQDVRDAETREVMKSLTAVGDLGVTDGMLHEYAHWPLLTGLLYGSQDPLAWIRTPLRKRVEELIGLS